MYYKAPDNSLHVLDSSEFEYLLPEGSVQITDSEAQVIIDANKPAPAPLVVSPRQIRMALTHAGLRADVESTVAAGDQDLKDWWQYATSFVETHPQVVAMAGQLNLSEAQVHDLFVLASSL